MRLKGDQGTARAMNRRLILNLLRREGPKSRAELAVLSGLSPATVTFVVGDLVEEGFVVEGVASRGATGRRPIPVEINYAGGLAVGLNEFAGYLAVGVTAFLTGYIAEPRGLRPAPFYLGIGYAVLGLGLSVVLTIIP